MDKELAAVKELMLAHFSAVLREVGETQRLQRITNGQVKDATLAIANLQPRVDALEDTSKAKASEENRGIRLFDVYLALASIAGTVTVIKFFGLLK